MELYKIQSLETHLFFGRIMKEHALFLEASLPAKETVWIRRTRQFRETFESFLEEVTDCSSDNIRNQVLESGEIVTCHTLLAERRTGQLTGIPINTDITKAQQRLCGSCQGRGVQDRCGVQDGHVCNREMTQKIRRLNRHALQLLHGFIRLKEEILAEVECCNLFTFQYPLLIQHIIREARLYQAHLFHLERFGMLCICNLRQQEVFWNQIMMEHAWFIRGLLDPTEEQLIGTAHEFSKEYGCLLEEAREAEDKVGLMVLTEKTRMETEKYRAFKEAGTKGITGCEISSVILPLLADHVLREANHYLRIL